MRRPASHPQGFHSLPWHCSQQKGNVASSSIFYLLGDNGAQAGKNVFGARIGI